MKLRECPKPVPTAFAPRHGTTLPFGYLAAAVPAPLKAPWASLLANG